MSKILVPTDFTPAAENALELACQMASIGNQEVVLFHVISSATDDLLKKKGKKRDELVTYMNELCLLSDDNHAVKVVSKTSEGGIITNIVDASAEHGVEWVMMGTHGTRGIRQSLFGADVLKIAEQAPVPVLTIPDNADTNKGIRKILFPFGGHEQFQNKIDAVASLASHFEAEVIFYSIDRHAAEVSKSVMDRIEEAGEHYSREGIPNSLKIDEDKSFSVGFAKQTLSFAEENEADVIAVMASDAGSLSFISSVDRENLINNEKGISILLVNE